MIVNIRQAMVVLGMTFTATIMPVPASAARPPTKFTLSYHVGKKVDRTTDANICTEESGDNCEGGEIGTEPLGFQYPEGLAVNSQTGDVYVADKSNSRVQEFSSEGKFVLMFGWKVNKTKENEDSSQAEQNVCTAASGNTCQAGEGWSEERKGKNINEVKAGLAGQMNLVQDLAIDPISGNVYVLEPEYNRIEEFTALGGFILMLGAGVNKKGGDICTDAEEAECQAGVEGSGHGEFKKLAAVTHGTLLAVGPEDHLLYVGDEGRVQKFETDGKWVGEVSLAGLSSTGFETGVAVDKSGVVFVTDSAVPGVHEYNASGALQSCVIDPSSSGIDAIALDPYERLGVIDLEPTPHGALYDTQGAECGHQQGGTIAPPSGEMPYLPTGLAFSFNAATIDRLYVSDAEAVHEVQAYVPVVSPVVRTCATEEVLAVSARLCGEVDPEDLSTTGFFGYGTSTVLGSRTGLAFGPSESEILEPMHYVLTGIEPNQSYYDEAEAEAEANKEKEIESGPPVVSFHTSTPPPEVPGEPSASFETDQSAVLSASVNPEHAVTSYHFEYGPCKELSECSEIMSTKGEQAIRYYGLIGVIQEVTGLLPQTTYSFRLVANNELDEGKPEGGEEEGLEGHLMTASAPNPSAQTGGYGGVTATSATITGAVDPDGQRATYAFELGVYDGALTQYGIVFSGPVGGEGTAVPESLALSGLQPGTTYAYRITLSSGYVIGASHTVYGEPVLFVTGGTPVLFRPTVVEQLPVPKIAFPRESGKPAPKKLTRAQQLARALKACEKSPKNKRVACKRSARKRFGPSKKKARKSSPSGKGAARRGR
ncbi:MAG TPA: hypothetical protein VIJ39_10420 [Solirubrobacteraceae bacterium]